MVVSAEEGGRGVNQLGNSGEVGAQLGLSVSTPVLLPDGASLCVARRGDLVGEDEVVFVGKSGDTDRRLVVPGFIRYRVLGPDPEPDASALGGVGDRERLSAMFSDSKGRRMIGDK